MKVWMLMENTASRSDLQFEHGLSLYVEACGHKILFDVGQSAGFAENAARLDVDLSQVDIAILSHGHYDHGGGLRRFFDCNDHASVYINRYAFEPHYARGEKYIGLEAELSASDRIIYTEDICEIDDGLTLYSCNGLERRYPSSDTGMGVLRKGQLLPDDFRHEQYLVICEDTKRVVFSGCSHKGVLNIVSWLQPDILIGGFHFKGIETVGEGEAFLQKAAEKLRYSHTRYYTCHCTGLEQYALLKAWMGESLHYLSGGQVIAL